MVYCCSSFECYLAFDWQSLPQDAIVVDVGGGIGTSALTLARTHPHLKIVVQDIPNVVEEGRKVNLTFLFVCLCVMAEVLLRQVWAREFPEAIESGRVTLQSKYIFLRRTFKFADDYSNSRP